MHYEHIAHDRRGRRGTWVSTSTLRRWERNRRHGGAQDDAYARVSSQDQKADLVRQEQVLELYCASQGASFDVIADLGSG